MLWRTPLKRAMTGDDVRSWQLELVNVGLLNQVDVDGAFGPRTEKATIQFQLDHRLVPDGVVGKVTRAKIGDATTERRSVVTGLIDPQWHFIQAKNYTPSAGRSVSMVIMHSMESPDRPDTAEGVAAWFAGLRGTAPQASAHACVDLDSLVQCVRPEDVAWGAQGANACGYHIEQAGYAKWTHDEWLSAESSSMLSIAAAHVNLACDHFNLPIIKLGLEEVAALIRDSLVRQRKIAGVVSGHPGGICQHKDITTVWQGFDHYGLPNPRQSNPAWWPTHSDCGVFYPMDELLERAHH